MSTGAQVLTAAQVRDLSRELMEAERTRRPVDQITSRFEGVTVTDAYRIQMATIETKVAAGRKIIGKKVGLTSKAMQDLLGVSEPDYGHLLDDMLVPEGETIDSSALCQPTISSRSAGPGTRQNIDEFTQTTAKGLVTVGGAEKGKAIIILNPAEPPIIMRNTIYTLVEGATLPRSPSRCRQWSAWCRATCRVTGSNSHPPSKATGSLR